MAFCILSLDGGGTWSLIQIRVLQHLYGPDATGHEVLSNFGLVVANSGGSVVFGGRWRIETVGVDETVSRQIRASGSLSLSECVHASD
jgi:uncharacterized protein